MTREFKIIITIFLLFFFNNQLSAFAKSLNNEIDVNNRIREISQNVRCLVCQNQSIDESNSELAKDLKILIKEKLILGDSDEEIYGFLKERYGDYILLKPPLNLNTVILWFLPFVVLMFGSILIFKIIKSNKRK
jgi:cytochrome c-type biogenesis protein CcmH